MTLAAIYARYSSDRQNENSVADQIALCSRFAAQKGWEVSRVFSDAAISGSAMANRPGLLDALAAAERREFDILLVEDEDRLARNLEHMAHVANRLEDADVKIWTIGSGQVETMHVAFKGAMAQDFIKNLSRKTKRGMHANAEKGLATGSKLYGYASEPGGGMTIVQAEADVIRRIFADYASGDTAREIATALNAECVPGPRGGLWNQSSISGSVQRGNGILNTELYAGVKVWNRMDVRKDRSTGKRTPRMRPESEWKRTEVPHLRIVDPAVWEAVRRRKSANSARPSMAQRRPGVFSGLLKCGVCGGTYTAYTGGNLICATHREKGTCDNRRTPNRAAVENIVLEALRDELLTPEAVARYIRTYHQAENSRRKALASQRAPLHKRLAQTKGAIDRIVSAIERGVSTDVMEARLLELDRERRDIEAALTEMDEAPKVVTVHPGAAEKYGELIAELKETLEDLDLQNSQAQRRLVEAVRAVIDRIVIMPRSQARGGPIDVQVYGTLARFMGGEEEQPANALCGAVVAGGCYRLSPPCRSHARRRLTQMFSLRSRSAHEAEQRHPLPRPGQAGACRSHHWRRR